MRLSGNLYGKDYSILGSILRLPTSGNPHIAMLRLAATTVFGHLRAGFIGFRSFHIFRSKVRRPDSV